MAQITFPEDMNKLGDNTKDNFKTIEDYIAYMCERADFSIRDIAKTVSELQKRVDALENE